MHSSTPSNGEKKEKKTGEKETTLEEQQKQWLLDRDQGFFSEISILTKKTKAKENILNSLNDYIFKLPGTSFNFQLASLLKAKYLNKKDEIKHYAGRNNLSAIFHLAKITSDINEAISLYIYIKQCGPSIDRRNPFIAKATSELRTLSDAGRSFATWGYNWQGWRDDRYYGFDFSNHLYINRYIEYIELVGLHPKGIIQSWCAKVAKYYELYFDTWHHLEIQETAMSFFERIAAMKEKKEEKEKKMDSTLIDKTQAIYEARLALGTIYFCRDKYDDASHFFYLASQCDAASSEKDFFTLCSYLFFGYSEWNEIVLPNKNMYREGMRLVNDDDWDVSKRIKHRLEKKEKDFLDGRSSGLQTILKGNRNKESPLQTAEAFYNVALKRGYGTVRAWGLLFMAESLREAFLTYSSLDSDANTDKKIILFETIRSLGRSIANFALKKTCFLPAQALFLRMMKEVNDYSPYSSVLLFESLMIATSVCFQITKKCDLPQAVQFLEWNIDIVLEKVKQETTFFPLLMQRWENIFRKIDPEVNKQVVIHFFDKLASHLMGEMKTQMQNMRARVAESKTTLIKKNKKEEKEVASVELVDLKRELVDLKKEKFQKFPLLFDLYIQRIGLTTEAGEKKGRALIDNIAKTCATESIGVELEDVKETKGLQKTAEEKKDIIDVKSDDVEPMNFSVVDNIVWVRIINTIEKSYLSTQQANKNIYDLFVFIGKQIHSSVLAFKFICMMLRCYSKHRDTELLMSGISSIHNVLKKDEERFLLETVMDGTSDAYTDAKLSLNIEERISLRKIIDQLMRWIPDNAKYMKEYQRKLYSELISTALSETPFYFQQIIHADIMRDLVNWVSTEPFLERIIAEEKRYWGFGRSTPAYLDNLYNLEKNFFFIKCQRKEEEKEKEVNQDHYNNAVTKWLFNFEKEPSDVFDKKEACGRITTLREDKIFLSQDNQEMSEWVTWQLKENKEKLLLKATQNNNLHAIFCLASIAKHKREQISLYFYLLLHSEQGSELNKATRLKIGLMARGNQSHAAFAEWADTFRRGNLIGNSTEYEKTYHHWMKEYGFYQPSQNERKEIKTNGVLAPSPTLTLPRSAVNR